MRRFDPGYVDLKARLDAGEIGAPLLMHCAHRNVSVHDFFDSAMILTDSAVHEIDVARWLLEDEIARVTVLAPRPTAARDPGCATRSCCCSRRPRAASSTSRPSSARATATTSAARSWGRTGRSSSAATVALRTGWPGTRSPPASSERFATAYLNELQAWVAAKRGRAPWDGYAAAAVAEAAVQSLETGRPVDVRLA